MKRCKAMIGLLAVFGVMLNAALIVRHHAAMMQMALAPSTTAAKASETLDPSVPEIAALAADLQVRCQTSGAEDEGGTGRTGNGMSTCPLCMGLSQTVAVLTPADVIGLALPTRGIRFALPRRDDRVEVQRRIRPPGRAPPLTA